MNSDNFYKTLSALKRKFKWELDNKNNIVGTDGTFMYNPITAIASFVGYESPTNNKRQTLKVARALGLEKGFAEQVYDASNCLANRGQAQIIRGRIRSALGL